MDRDQPRMSVLADAGQRTRLPDHDVFPGVTREQVGPGFAFWLLSQRFSFRIPTPDFSGGCAAGTHPP